MSCVHGLHFLAHHAEAASCGRGQIKCRLYNRPALPEHGLQLLFTLPSRLFFSYEILTPAALNFFVSYADGAVESLWSIDQYFEFVLLLMLSTGLSFQVGGKDLAWLHFLNQESHSLMSIAHNRMPASTRRSMLTRAVVNCPVNVGNLDSQILHEHIRHAQAMLHTASYGRLAQPTLPPQTLHAGACDPSDAGPAWHCDKPADAEPVAVRGGGRDSGSSCAHTINRPLHAGVAQGGVWRWELYATAC